MTSRCHMALGLAALFGGACGCSEPDVNAQPVTYLGALDESSVQIAVVRGGDAIEVFVCGEGETLESHSRWFEGTTGAGDGGVTELANRGWRVSIELDAFELSGELIAPDGGVERWQAERIADDASSAVGLYDSFKLGCRAGVIVWRAPREGSCRAQGAWCNESGDIGPLTLEACPAGGSLRARANDGGEAFELTVERVEGP